jgi:hypothetical protein
MMRTPDGNRRLELTAGRRAQIAAADAERH